MWSWCDHAVIMMWSWCNHDVIMMRSWCDHDAIMLRAFQRSVSRVFRSCDSANCCDGVVAVRSEPEDQSTKKNANPRFRQNSPSIGTNYQVLILIILIVLTAYCSGSSSLYAQPKNTAASCSPFFSRSDTTLADPILTLRAVHLFSDHFGRDKHRGKSDPTAHPAITSSSLISFALDLFENHPSPAYCAEIAQKIHHETFWLCVQFASPTPGKRRGLAW